LGGIVGVQGGEYQVSRLGGLDRDLRRLQVANLPTMTMSGSLPQKGPQCRREGEFGLYFMLTWLIPGTRISTGSSTVEMLTSDRLRISNAL